MSTALRPPSPRPNPAATDKEFRETSRAMSGAEEREAFHFEQEGRRFQATWTPGSRSAPTTLRLFTHLAAEGGLRRTGPRVESPAPLLLRKEGALDRLGKRLGINREVQTGDPAFDGRIYLESEAPDRSLQQVLGEAQARAGVLACLDWGATSVVLEPDGRLGVAVQLPKAAQVAPEGLHTLAGLLARVAEALPPLQPPATDARQGAARARLVLGACLGSVLALLAFLFALLTWSTVDTTLQLLGLLGGLAAWGLILPLLVRRLRGHPTSFREVCLCSSFLLLGLPMGGMALVLFLNCGMDFSPPLDRETTIAHLRMVRGSKSSTYYVRLPSWRPDADTLEFKVSASDYRRFREGQAVVARTRPGLLGAEWLVSLEPAARPRFVRDE